MIKEVQWTFSCYMDRRGHNNIHLFLKDLDKKALMDLRRALQHLKTKPVQLWSRPQASFIINHIYVIRFKSAQGQFRLFGHHDGNTQSFVITVPGAEKDGKYTPTNYADLATERMAQCIADPQRFTCRGLDPDAE